MNKKERKLKGIARAEKVLRVLRGKFPNHSDVFSMKNKIGKKLIHTRKSCSCWMCGNPRKYTGKPTIQEEKVQEYFAVERWD